MVVPVEQLSIKSTTAGGTSALGSTKAALGDRLGQIINVKTDFGATGNGSTDDRAAIQAALDAAFGPASAPHGTANKSLNKPVYFPAGEYKINGTLYLTDVASGWIFGAGMDATRIFYGGAAGAGNSVIPNPTLTITNGSISGTTLTVTAVTIIPNPASDVINDTLLYNGSVLSGTGVTVGTTVTGTQLTYTPNGTHGVSNGTTTFVDATFNAFTAGMVGHTLRITTGAGAGQYRIRGFNPAFPDRVTLDVAAIAASGATWRVEGYTGTYQVTPSNSATGTISINVAALGSEITPLWMANGFAYSTFEKMNLSNSSGAGSCCFYLFQDGTALSGSSTTDIFNEVLFDTASVAFLAGYQSNGLCSEILHQNCVWANCGYGLRLRSFNALNHVLVNSGGNSCSIAAISIDAGSVNSIISFGGAGNALDLLSISNSQVSIIGGRTESTNSIQTAAGAPVFVTGFIYQPIVAGTFVQAGGGGCVIMEGCSYTPGIGNGTIVALGGDGTAILDKFTSQPQSSGSGTITGTGTSKLFLRGGCSFDNPSTLSGFAGTIAEYVVGPLTFATLPTPSAAFKGVRLVITDSSVTTFGANAAGGGSTTVPVYCDGSNWKVG